MTDYKKIDDTVLEILSEMSKKFPDDTEKFVKEFVAVGETVLAIETLCIQSFEYGIEMSTYNKYRLRRIARLMNMKVEKLPGL